MKIRLFLISVFAIILSASILSARERTFRSMGVGKFVKPEECIDVSDAGTFYKILENAGLKGCGLYLDGDASISKFKPDQLIDYMYFTGHGNFGYFWIANGSDEKAVKAEDLGDLNSNVRHFAAASCDTVSKIADWKSCFTGRLQSFCGYQEETFSGSNAHKVATAFAKKLTKLSEDASGQAVIEAWADANWFSSYTKKWTGIGYSGEDKKLYFWYAKGDQIESERNAGKTSLSYAGGRLQVACPVENRAIQKFHKITAKSGKLPGMDILNRNSGVQNLASGAVLYSRKFDFTSSVSEAEALKLAEDFLEKNGGIPADFENRQSQPICRNDESENEQIVGWSISYDKNLDGIPVAGPAGESIRVLISGSSVTGFFRLNRETSSDRSPVSILPVREILALAADSIVKSARTTKNLMITDIETVYHSPDFEKIEADYTPAYRLTFAGGGTLYLSAIDGAILW
ncbi:MAG: hypothetical protein PHW04_00170 [Candidatus Wallbacteria bacterium]|nr:hypothetical protein [Candidatus Wallbacteria bacterium]